MIVEVLFAYTHHSQLKVTIEVITLACPTICLGMDMSFESNDYKVEEDVPSSFCPLTAAVVVSVI
ncbi:hypothetical protein TYRP_013016 [Tyrophagus putrescentiae]|nr:hypothetical protein TYRP_013016 [Tyrophagus putrescentiae]